MNASKINLRCAEIVRAHSRTSAICAGLAHCLTLMIILVLLLAGVLWGPRLARRAAGLPVGNERLFHAVMRDDVQEVRRALAEGASPNAPLAHGQPALMLATNGRSTTIMEELLKAGADVSYSDSVASTPLLRASMQNRIEFVRLLLKYGADPNQPDARIKPLIGAAGYGRCEVVQMLLEAGAEVDVRGPDGRTPLMFAAYADHVQAVHILLRAGADINAIDDEGNTAAAIATAAGSDHSADLLEMAAKHPLDTRYARKPTTVKPAQPIRVGKGTGPSMVIWPLL